MKAIIAQSGGPTTAINASLAGAISVIKKSEVFESILGSLNGVTGIFDDRTVDLGEIFDTDEKLETLKCTPAMYLGSCRYKLSSKEECEKIFNYFAKHDIGAFFYIGGNDSMDTVDKLSAYANENGSDVKIIGIPKTIDNDLVMIDHTPGFGSAAKYVATSMLEIAHDVAIYKQKTVTIVEIMGRDAGWLTASAALARNSYNESPDYIYLPEVAFSDEQFLCDLQKALEKKNNIVIAVSEGIRYADGNYVSASSEQVDKFGHAQLCGAGKYLENLVKDELGLKVRSVEINILQRAAAHMASKTDLDESFALGAHAVMQAEEGVSGVMVALERKPGSVYEVAYKTADIKSVANGVKEVPREWINAEGNDVTSEMYDYLRPLILGEAGVKYQDGLPVFCNVAHLVTK